MFCEFLSFWEKRELCVLNNINLWCFRICYLLFQIFRVLWDISSIFIFDILAYLIKFQIFSAELVKHGRCQCQSVPLSPYPLWEPLGYVYIQYKLCTLRNMLTLCPKSISHCDLTLYFTFSKPSNFISTSIFNIKLSETITVLKSQTVLSLSTWEDRE